MSKVCAVPTVLDLPSNEKRQHKKNEKRMSIVGAIVDAFFF